MIVSFASTLTQQLFLHGRHVKVGRHVGHAAQRKLVLLDSAMSLRDLMVVPGNRLEQLRGAMAGYHSIRVNRQWRIIFRWNEEGAHDVGFVDYH